VADVAEHLGRTLSAPRRSSHARAPRCAASTKRDTTMTADPLDPLRLPICAHRASTGVRRSLAAAHAVGRPDGAPHNTHHSLFRHGPGYRGRLLPPASGFSPGAATKPCMCDLVSRRPATAAERPRGASGRARAAGWHAAPTRVMESHLDSRSLTSTRRSSRYAARVSTSAMTSPAELPSGRSCSKTRSVIRSCGSNPRADTTSERVESLPQTKGA
jgi:hypothetical protein